MQINEQPEDQDPHYYDSDEEIMKREARESYEEDLMYDRWHDREFDE